MENFETNSETLDGFFESKVDQVEFNNLWCGRGMAWHGVIQIFYVLVVCVTR